MFARHFGKVRRLILRFVVRICVFSQGTSSCIEIRSAYVFVGGFAVWSTVAGLVTDLRRSLSNSAGR